MTIATEASIKAIRGPAYVEKLLDVARAGLDTPTEQEQARQDRLNYALTAADALIARYLPLPADRSSAPPTLRQIADEHALYVLQMSTPREATENEMEMAHLREKNLLGMRERREWPGDADNQRNVETAIVSSGSPLSLSRLVGYSITGEG